MIYQLLDILTWLAFLGGGFFIIAGGVGDHSVIPPIATDPPVNKVINFNSTRVKQVTFSDWLVTIWTI